MIELGHGLYSLPSRFNNHWTDEAERILHQLLFESLAAQRRDYLQLFFPKGLPTASQSWSLRQAQDAIDGAEYLPAARGTACGHIFKSGETTYSCKTCAVDDSCVLCTRCFESSDHEGHQVYVSITSGNSSCCDCGDKEAWKVDLTCSIHSDDLDSAHNAPKDKGKLGYTSPELPKDLVDAIQMTVSRAIDFLCDVFSCSPEQMRLAKTEDSIREDERLSRLSPIAYGVQEDAVEEHPEFALNLWNDEKHSVDDVTNQIAKACRVTRTKGLERAREVDDVGRSTVHYSHDVGELLRMAKVIEELKLTTTIRSARDSFRERMCAAIIEWLTDISGCAVGDDGALLRNVVCEELLKPWRSGSQAGNKKIATHGLDDHEKEDSAYLRQQQLFMLMGMPLEMMTNATGEAIGGLIDTIGEDDDQEEDEEYDDLDVNDDDHMELEVDMPSRSEAAENMEVDFLEEDNDVTEAMEAALAGYPAPPPPPQTIPASRRQRVMTPADSDDGEPEQSVPTTETPFGEVPKTPQVKTVNKRPARPSRHWLVKPDAFKGARPNVPCEDLWQRIRLDWLIMYDIRLWKVLRTQLRHLFLGTVVVIPQFRRILALRFAALYTPLAELYLIADREPDHSIISLSVQMLTTPSITEDIIERGNFLTNLMALLYTFLTTRQVGYPEEVNPKAVLAFEAGTVTNRRIIHFFHDLRFLFQSEYVRWKLRTESQYLLQFLDLVKLHQGICPNVRATGEHVEYESDAWYGASAIINWVNKLCRQAALSFEPNQADMSNQHLIRAIRQTAQIALINSFGYERKRFYQAELKSLLQFHTVGPFIEGGKLFSKDGTYWDDGARFYKVPRFIVQTEALSFQHPLHYLLSWMIEHARGLDQDTARELLTFTAADLKDPFNNVRNAPAYPQNLSTEKLLGGLLDPPLRVCAWLAQTKAGMWVRNGNTVRHQASSYRSVANRDIGYQRDILLVQTGLVLSGEPGRDQGESFLAQIIDRFQMVNWMRGDYSITPGFEESQQLDVLEDFYHLLVIALSERGNLTPRPQSQRPQAISHLSDRVLKHDIAHALCFKPLSFSELNARVPEKVSDSDGFNRVLESMTKYKAPEGLSDTGMFELKAEYIELIDPYYAHYNRNLREEAEVVYRNHMARKTGQLVEEVVYESRLAPIESGIFKDLAAFTRSTLFAQVIFAALDYALVATTGLGSIQATRIETFLHMVLHLAQIAVLEEKSIGQSATFTAHASNDIHKTHSGQRGSIVQALLRLLQVGVYTSCHSTIKYILRNMLQRQPGRLSETLGLAQSLDRTTTDSPASMTLEGKEKRKQEAVARQARVMAQMKQQQKSFLLNQGLEAFEDDDDQFGDFDDAMSISQDTNDASMAKTAWHFPTGTCILCQEATDDQRLFGTFAFLGESSILRTTPVKDEEYVQEVLDTPANLDRLCQERPFGVSGKNKAMIARTSTNGAVSETTRQGLSKGFPQSDNSIKGPVSTSCGHIMHYGCFELYFNATLRRHAQQIARNHPETAAAQEFICPLCKALGNTFLPIVWKSKECSNDSELSSVSHLETWLARNESFSKTVEQSPGPDREDEVLRRCKAYVAGTFMPSLVASMDDMSLSNSSSQAQPRYSLRRGYSNSITSLLRLGRNDPDTTLPPHIPRQSAPLSPAEQSPNTAELVKAYSRARDTISANGLARDHIKGDRFTMTGSTFARALGMTVSAVEIAHRGTSSHEGGTILNDLTDQTVTHLRILAETFDSYYGVEVLRPNAQTTKAGFAKEQDVLRGTLFLSSAAQSPGGNNALLEEDVFLFFNNWSAYMNPDLNEALAILQICLWAEIVKVIVAYREVSTEKETSMGGDVYKMALQSSSKYPSLFKGEDAIPKYDHMRELVNKYALAYLRKCLILMHIRYGLDFDEKLRSDADELERLTKLLHITSVTGLFNLFLSDNVAGERLRDVTDRWMRITHGSSVTVPHPAIFELVGLPKNYDTLTDEAAKRRCPTTGKEITDPSCCLFCGDIFCSQAVCCMKDGHHGGCWQHTQRCGNGKVGMFLNIRKCMVLFMHGMNGAWIPAPYLDRHGELDASLRRHYQLFLNQKRYDKLMREVWLRHGVQNVISRKLESDINTGGWETL